MLAGSERWGVLAGRLVACLWLAAATAAAEGLLEPDAETVPVANAGFEDGERDGLPARWQAYKSSAAARRREIVPEGPGKALLLADDDTTEEIGVAQTFPLQAGRYYELAVRARADGDRPADAAYAQLRFLPSGKLAQATVRVGPAGQPATTWVGEAAPAGTDRATIYLYTAREQTTHVIIDEVVLRVGDVKDFTQLSEPKKRVLDTTLVRAGQPAAVIVVPAAEPWAEQGRDLAAQLRDRLGVDVPVRPAGELTAADLQAATAILLGHLGVNRALLYPYSHSLCFSDGLYPGAGGYEVRTVHDPWGNGRNLVVLGASDPAGQHRAVQAFLERVPPAGRDVVLAPLFATELGPAAAGSLGGVFTRTLDAAWRQAQEEEAERQLKQGIHCGLFALAQRYGLWYALSQRPEYAQVFVWTIRRALAHYETKPTTYGGPWGMDSDFQIHRVVPLWDAVEECPALTDQDRLEVSRILHQWVRDLIHKGRAQGDRVRFNHTTFPALGGLYAGQYFERYYDDAQAKQWLRQAHEVFRFQANTTKPHCDCNSYQWLTVHHTMLYALATGDLTFFENGNLRRLADYLLLGQNPLGDGVAYGDIGGWRGGRAGDPLLRGAYWFQPDPTVAWLLGGGGPDDAKPVPGAYALPLGEQRPPAELLGVVAWPLTQPWYDTFPGVQATPFAATVDKIACRSGYDADAAYLLLDGIGGGGHGHMEANAVLQWCEQGRIWLTDGDYIKSLPKFHNTLLVLRDGQSVRPPDACELRHAADLPAAGYTCTALRRYAGVDWCRSVVWLKGRWFAVIDRMTAQEPGDYSLRAVWQTLGTTRVTGSALDVEQGGRQARIAFVAGTPTLVHADPALGSNWRSYPYAGDGSVRVFQGLAGGPLAAGDRRDLATVLDAAGEKPSVATIERLAEGLYRVTDEVGPALIALPDGSGLCRIGPAFHLAAGAVVLTPERLAAFAAALPGRPALADVEQNLATGNTVGREPAATAAGPQTAAQALALPGSLIPSDAVPALLATAAAPAAASGAALAADLPGLPLQWSVVDTPAELVLSNNRGTPARVDAGMTLHCRPAPLAANIFSGEAGRNLPESLLDGQLQGTSGATMWDTDQAVTVDLTFPESVRVTGVEVHVWHADQSSKGKAFGIARLEAFAGTADPAATALATRTDTETHPDWGTPVAHRLGDLACETRGLRLVLTPRPGRSVYVAEIVVRGDAEWLRRRLAGAPAGHFTALDLADVNADGQPEVLAGSTSGQVFCFEPGGGRLWQAEFGAPVRAVAGVAFAGPDAVATVVAGGDRDVVCGYAGSDGKTLWTHAIERYKTAGDVAVLWAADLDGNGRPLAVAGARNWRFHVLGADGTKRWHYESVHPSTAGAAADLNGDGRAELLLGTAYYGWHAVRPDGSPLWSYRTRGGPGCNVVAAGDVTGDRVPEVFFGGQDALVQAADAAGRPLWQANTGDEVTGLVLLDADGDGADEVVAGSLSFNLFCLDGDGHIRWRRDLGSPVRGLAKARSAGRDLVVAATQAGGVWWIDPRQGQPLARHRLDHGVTRLAVRDDLILAADESGRLSRLSAPP